MAGPPPRGWARHGYAGDHERATKVAVIGAAGRMGARCAVPSRPPTTSSWSAAYDHGDDLGDLGGAEVVVEFSVPDASPANVAHCVEQGVHVVVGTTGWDDEPAGRPSRDQLARRTPGSASSSPRTSPSAPSS